MFVWDSLDWAYHTIDILPGNISLPDKNGNLYTVTRDEPTSSHTSLGVKVALHGGQEAELLYSLTCSYVTIALNGKSALNQSGGDWPLSVDQPYFDYLQVIRG